MLYYRSPSLPRTYLEMIEPTHNLQIVGRLVALLHLHAQEEQWRRTVGRDRRLGLERRQTAHAEEVKPDSEQSATITKARLGSRRHSSLPAPKYSCCIPFWHKAYKGCRSRMALLSRLGTSIWFAVSSPGSIIVFFHDLPILYRKGYYVLCS